MFTTKDEITREKEDEELSDNKLIQELNRFVVCFPEFRTIIDSPFLSYRSEHDTALQKDKEWVDAQVQKYGASFTDSYIADRFSISFFEILS